jgi:hypothetical protein
MTRKSCRFSPYLPFKNLVDHAAADRTLSFRPRSALICMGLGGYRIYQAQGELSEPEWPDYCPKFCKSLSVTELLIPKVTRWCGGFGDWRNEYF